MGLARSLAVRRRLPRSLSQVRWWTCAPQSLEAAPSSIDGAIVESTEATSSRRSRAEAGLLWGSNLWVSGSRSIGHRGPLLCGDPRLFIHGTGAEARHGLQSRNAGKGMATPARPLSKATGQGPGGSRLPAGGSQPVTVGGGSGPSTVEGSVPSTLGVSGSSTVGGSGPSTGAAPPKPGGRRGVSSWLALAGLVALPAAVGYYYRDEVMLLLGDVWATEDKGQVVDERPSEPHQMEAKYSLSEAVGASGSVDVASRHPEGAASREPEVGEGTESSGAGREGITREEKEEAEEGSELQGEVEEEDDEGEEEAVADEKAIPEEAAGAEPGAHHQPDVHAGKLAGDGLAHDGAESLTKSHDSGGERGGGELLGVEGPGGSGSGAAERGTEKVAGQRQPRGARRPSEANLHPPSVVAPEALVALAHEAAARRAAEDRERKEEAARQAAAAAAEAAVVDGRSTEEIASDPRPGDGGSESQGVDEGPGKEGAVAGGGVRGAGEGPGFGVLVFEAVHESMQRQAEVDAEVMRVEMERLRDQFMEELSDARVEAVRHAQLAHKLEKELDRVHAAHKHRHAEQQRLYEEQRQAELKKKDEEKDVATEEAAALAAAKAAARMAVERAERVAQLDEIRLGLGALRVAFNSRSEDHRKSHTAHMIAMAAFALEDALQRGAPLMTEAALLQAAVEGRGGDPVVAVAMGSLPVAVVEDGAVTRAQLRERLMSLSPALRQLSFLPEGSGGLLAHAVAWLAARLKLSESPLLLHLDSPDALLEKARVLLAHGMLAEAAASLEKATQGSQASPLAAQWAQAARNRVVAEQAVRMVQAHAASLAAGLS